MQRRILGMLAALVLLTVTLGAARAADDQNALSQAKQGMQRQIDLLDSVKPYVERQDLGRLLLLRIASQEVLDAINKRGLLNLITVRAYENLILRYRFSKVYFSEIATSGTEAAILEAQNIAEDCAKQLNFDDSVYTQVTFNTYDQTYKLVVQLLQMTIPNELRVKLEALKAPLGQLTAMAKGGDNYEVLKAAVAPAEQVMDLYQLFYQIPTSDSAYHLVLEIQGLNQWFIEKSQIPVNRKKY